MTLDLSRDSRPGTAPPGAAGVRAWFAGLPLHWRFALVGSIVSFLGMLIVGNLVTASIETGVVRNSAISSAVYMESFSAPMSQELAGSDGLSPDTIARMRMLLNGPPLADRIQSVKIWQAGGLIAFSSDPDLIGQTLPPSDDLAAAWQGELTASFDELEDAENARERLAGVPLLEVYNPIHSIVTGEVIAVAEFYLDASELNSDLTAALARA